MLTYEPGGDRHKARWRLIAITTGIIAALVATVLMRISRVAQFPRPNTSWTYPERVGVDRALRDIAIAISQYCEAKGALPPRAELARSYLRCARHAPADVNCEELLPYVSIVTPTDARTARIAAGRSFFVIVYLKRAKGMKWDAAMVGGQNETASDGLYFENDIVRNFGVTRLKELKQNAFQLE